jgi:dipeptide/tripeptide permease
LFFSMFYFAVNSGSLLSTIITPELRVSKCFGHDCYFLAFGVPALLMISATLIFVMGSKFYKVVAPRGNVMVKVLQIIHCAAFKRRDGRIQGVGTHWLDVATEKYGSAMVEDTKS